MTADDRVVQSAPKDLMQWAARRAEERPEFFAWALARFLEAEGITIGALASQLGVPTTQMPKLALCRRPRAKHFAADVAMIAKDVGSSAQIVAYLARYADALEAMGAGQAGATGALLAARERLRLNDEDQESNDDTK